MKKFSALLAILFLFSQAANATGFYVGADALFSSARHAAKNPSSIVGPRNGDKQDNNNLGYGANLGFRLDVLNLLASAEIFYEGLNNVSHGFNSASGQGNSSDSIEIKNRYGAKANVGFAILPGVTPFLTYGLANVNYNNDVLSRSLNTTKSEMTPLYGLGVLFDLPLGFSLKAAYDYQHLNIRSAEPGAKIKTNLGIARVGISYNF